MQFLVYGGDPFIKSDICEMLAAEFPNAPVVDLDNVDALQKAAAEATEPVIGIFAVHEDVVKLANILLQEGRKRGAVILIRNDLPDQAESALPLYHLAKPFSSRELVALVKSVRSDLPATRS